MSKKSLLNDTFFSVVKDSLFRNGRFEAEDFSFTQKTCTNTRWGSPMVEDMTRVVDSKVKQGVELLVSYVFHNDFYLRVKVFPDEYQVTCCPGSVIRAQNQIFENQEAFFDRVEQWVGDLWEEITRDPLPVSTEKTLKELLGQFKEVPDDPFSIEDIEPLHQKLDELEAILKSQIEESIEDAKELKKKITQLESDINFLKQTASNLTQKNWFGSTTVKLKKWLIWGKKESLPEDDTIMQGDTIKKYLLPGESKTE